MNPKIKNLKTKMVGSVFPVVTPFTHVEGKVNPIDWPSLDKYIGYLIDGGATNIIVASATSRFSQLTVEEIKQLNRRTIQSAKSRNKDVLVIASTPIAGYTEEHIEVAVEAEKDGADVVICEYPWRYQGQGPLFNYFDALAKAVDIGVMLHVTPSRSEVKTMFGKTHRYSIEDLNKICEIENVVGMKEASGDKEHSKKIWEALGNKTNIIVAGRASEAFLEASRFGVKGFFSAAGSAYPKEDIEIYNLIIAGDYKKAKEIVAWHDTPFLDLCNKDGWHASLKVVLAELGLMEITERAPMVPVSETMRKKVEKELIRKP